MYASKYFAVSSIVRGYPCFTSYEKLIYAPFYNILSANPKY